MLYLPGKRPCGPGVGNKYFLYAHTITNTGETMKNTRPPNYSFVILTLILIVIDTILAWISSTIFPALGFGMISLLYIAAPVMILFTLWYGAYGAIAAYAGTLVGSGLMVSEMLVQHPDVAILWALAGLFQVLIPLAAIRSFGVDLSMKNPRDYTYVILFGVIINNLIGAAWGVWTLSLAETINIGSAFWIWFIGNVVLCILILPLALKLFTPKMERTRLYVKNYWY